MSRGTRELLDGTGGSAGVAALRPHERPRHDRGRRRTSSPTTATKWDDGAGGVRGSPHVIFRPSFVGRPRPTAASVPTSAGSRSSRRSRRSPDRAEQRRPADLGGRTSRRDFVRALDEEARNGRTFELGGPDVVELERALGPAQSGARRAAAEHSRADGADARERARDRAAPGATSRRLATPEDDGEPATTSSRTTRRRERFGLGLLPLDEQLRARAP